MQKLKNQAKILTDKRMKRKWKYKVWDIVYVALFEVISNCSEWSEIEINLNIVIIGRDILSQVYWIQ